MRRADLTLALWACVVLLCAAHEAYARQIPGAHSGRSLTCVDSYAACAGWGPGQCGTPGVATDCPCMCSTPSPTTASGGCVDSYAACASWGPSQCGTPGVATDCPCMCNTAPASPVPPPPITSSPAPPSPPAGTVGGTAPAGLVYGPYKDVGINMNWNTNVMSTAVTGTQQSVLSVLPAKVQALTWAFATGECGAENWGGISPSALANANVQNFVSAGRKYIISTGGAAGVFTCGTDAGFSTFIKTYFSNSMIGVDFDIEGGQTQAQIQNLVQRVAVARGTYPNMRWSFTLQTLGTSSTGNQLNTYGQWVMQALQAQGLGWNNIYINLMTMDYGSTSSTTCTIGSTGQCDMGQSAVNAAKALHITYGVPYSNIEITPMIGGNDSAGETFTLADADTVSAFAKANSLGGIHFWSFDRDRDCAPGAASPTCNTYGQAGTLGYTNRFITDLGL